MRMRLLLVAGFGLGLSCLAAAALLEREPEPLPQLAFPTLAARFSAADRIELVHDGEVLWLERRGQLWGLARQGGYPVRPDLARSLEDGLLTLRLLQPIAGTPDELGLADPFRPGEHGGVLVRVLGTSGATLCSVILRTKPGKVVRRPNDPQAWATNTALSVPADAESWSQHALPPLDPAEIISITRDGDDTPALSQALAGALPFTDVQPAPLHHPAAMQTTEVTLRSGTAILTLGMEDGQPWLSVSGTSQWARQLGAYAFALPPSSPLLTQ